ncbi:hypothetical protein ACFY64_07920 [Streptomyces collinus]
MASARWYWGRTGRFRFEGHFGSRLGRVKTGKIWVVIDKVGNVVSVDRN